MRRGLRRLRLQVSEYSESKRGFGGNMTQKKRRKIVPQPWFCPQCQVPQPAYANQCLTCLQPRTNSYGDS